MHLRRWSEFSRIRGFFFGTRVIVSLAPTALSLIHHTYGCLRYRPPCKNKSYLFDKSWHSTLVATSSRFWDAGPFRGVPS